MKVKTGSGMGLHELEMPELLPQGQYKIPDKRQQNPETPKSFHSDDFPSHTHNSGKLS
jgi:hypothetical protein